MICAIIQARMGSTRLPGKVLREINGRPMLSYMLERVTAAHNIDKVVLATSIDSSDDPIAELCRKNDILYYRGSVDDVLDRYYQAARRVKADIIVRLTGDCPLIDPRMIDCVIDIYKNGNYDYVANTTPPKWTVPRGMDVEVFSRRSLEEAFLEGSSSAEREHVTPYIYGLPWRYQLRQVRLAEDLSHHRWTVDTAEDLALVTHVLEALLPENPLFTMHDVLLLLKQHPERVKLNAGIAQKRV